MNTDKLIQNSIFDPIIDWQKIKFEKIIREWGYSSKELREYLNNYKYDIGDTYPRNGLNVLQSRINELASNKNLQKTPLIEEIPEKVEEPKKKKKSKSVEKADDE